MYLLSKTLRCLIVLTLFILLTSCVSFYRGIGDYTDRENYLETNFLSDSLKPEIEDEVKTEEFSSNEFSKMTIHYNMKIEKRGAVPGVENVFVTNINKGDGIILQVKEYSGNGIPYSLNFYTSYLDILDLRVQSVSLTRNEKNAFREIKGFHQFSPFHKMPSTGSEFVYEYDFGFVGFNSYTTNKLKYSIGEYLKASDIHPKLEGDAYILEAEVSYDGALNKKIKRIFLNHYGVALEKEASNPEAKITYEITDLTITTPNDVDRPLGLETSSQNVKIKEFIHSNYAQIMEELNTSPSGYLSALFILLNIPDAEQEKAVMKLKGLSLIYPDKAKFSTEVITFFGKPSTIAEVATEAGVQWKVPSVKKGEIVDVLPIKGNTFRVKVEEIDKQYIEGYAEYPGNISFEWFTEKFYYKDIRKLNGKPILNDGANPASLHAPAKSPVSTTGLYKKGDDIEIETATNNQVRISITRIGPTFIEGTVHKYLGVGGDEFPEKFMYKNIRKINGKQVSASELRKMFN